MESNIIVGKDRSSVQYVVIVLQVRRIPHVCHFSSHTQFWAELFSLHGRHIANHNEDEDDDKLHDTCGFHIF